jgi:hypothetical protein
MIKWIKQDGESEIETNDEPATIEYCESLGWTRGDAKKEAKEEQPKKRGRPKKEG